MPGAVTWENELKAVILAGGLGTRLSEETVSRPKPMVEIGGRPILWHIMKIYSQHNIDEFIVCLGYKGYIIKEYFANYFLHMSDVTFNMKENRMEVHQKRAEHWTVTLVDTGEHTMTGGRLKRIKDYLDGEKAFCLTYGDGVSDVNLGALVDFHSAAGTLATVTAVFAPGRFGAIDMKGGRARTFMEKPKGDGTRINGGFFVLSPRVIDYIDGDETIWEREPMENLARDGEMSAYEHDGFWQPMDTLRDAKRLDDLWQSGAAPWKTW